MKNQVYAFLSLIVTAVVSPFPASAQPLAGGFRILGKPPGQVRSQDMGAFAAGKWHDNDHLWWTGAKPGDKLSVVLPVDKEGDFHVAVVLTKARDYGIVQFYLDGKKAGKPIDLYSPVVVNTKALPLGKFRLAKGNHKLSVEIVGANPKAVKAYMFGLDVVRLQVAANPRDVYFHPSSLYPHVSLAPEAAAKAMQLPPGFSVQVAAAEPDVRQPIAMAIDDRGRLWVAEAHTYPQRAPKGKGKDRILIFEDTNLDGKLDKRTVFIENLNLVSGLEVGFGGVWVGAAPYLLFIPDKNGDDRPDGPPQVLLDGWGYQDTHETLNAFIWGPDGWLYGCHGVFTHSNVGKPGTPPDERVKINAGIWRYHPVRHEFEVFAHGTSNPWGVDFDEHGQAICIACVIPHIFHIVQGGRYHRQAGRHFNPHTYDDIKTIADHRHYIGNQWNNTDRKRSDDFGGGHAHAGAMIYQGGSWPAKYRNQIFMNNIHGNRINMDLLKTSGSGFIASHGPDFIMTGDQSSQILNLRYGPDGQVWMIDWYDRNQCHRREEEVHDRSNGRIYRVAYENAKPVRVDLRKLSDMELLQLHLSKNNWHVRHARRLLQERFAEMPLRHATLAALDRLAKHEEPIYRLRAIWTLYAIRKWSRERAVVAMRDDNPYVRAWAIQLWCDEGAADLSPNMKEKLLNLAKSDSSPIVRLYLASALQRIPLDQRWVLLQALTSHPEDATDHNLPLMYWYAMEPLAEVDMRRALALALVAGENIPVLQSYMIRRIGSGNAAKALQLLVEGLADAKQTKRQLAFLRGLNRALIGRRNAKAPAGWNDVYVRLRVSDTAAIKLNASALAAKFGDEKAVGQLIDYTKTRNNDLQWRKFALSSLRLVQPKSFGNFLHDLLDKNPKTELRSDVIRGLAIVDDPRTPPLLMKLYPSLTHAEKRDALATLCSRASYAQTLMAAVEKKRVPATDLTADFVRQLRNLNDAKLTKRITDVWGTVRETAEEKKKLIAKYKAMLNKPANDEPDLRLGRAMFKKTCQQCHTLFGEGGNVGPDITGANRNDLDYLLSNILDPSSVMAKEYQPTIVLTKSGRVVIGIVRDTDPNALTLQTSNEVVVIPRDDVQASKRSPQSMMPNDLLNGMKENEVRALFAYLRQTRQVQTAEAKE